MSSAAISPRERERERERERPEPSGRELTMLTVEVPAAGAARFLAVAPSIARAGADATAGDALLWAPPAGDADGWSFAGIGIAERAEAAGPDRIATIRAASARIFRSLSGTVVPGEPPLRMFGGFSFREGEDSPGAWEAFGEASFTLPRFLYAEREGRAWLRAIVPVEEGGALAAAIPILYRMRAALATHDVAMAERCRVIRAEELARDAWSRRVVDALAAMHGRTLDKVVLARRTRVELDRTPSASVIAAALPGEGTTRFAIGRRGKLFAGATPERLVSLREGRIRCDALGGSLPRSGDTDGEIEALRRSSKDGREHAEVVAGIRAALAPLATQLASDGPRVRTLATVHHLHTEVTGAALAGVDALALVAALHPTPAVCGSPREPARDWIAEHEGAPRGWYAGPVGWIDARGEGAFCVALRCALIAEREAWLYAGAGLVEGSDADAEWRETAAKQAPMMRVLGGAG